MFGLSGLAVKLIIVAVLMLGAATFSGWAVHKIDLASYEKLELSYAKAQAEAVAKAKAEQIRVDEISRNAAQQEATKQLAAADLARRQLKDLQKYVKNRPTDCFSLGFIRVLDAKIYSVLGERLPLPSGKSNDSCSTFTASSLAGAIGDIIDAANANSRQLNSLIEGIRQGAKK